MPQTPRRAPLPLALALAPAPSPPPSTRTSVRPGSSSPRATLVVLIVGAQSSEGCDCALPRSTANATGRQPPPARRAERSRGGAAAARCSLAAAAAAGPRCCLLARFVARVPCSPAASASPSSSPSSGSSDSEPLPSPPPPPPAASSSSSAAAAAPLPPPPSPPFPAAGSFPPLANLAHRKHGLPWRATHAPLHLAAPWESRASRASPCSDARKKTRRRRCGRPKAAALTTRCAHDV